MFSNALDRNLQKHEPLERLLGYRKVETHLLDARDLDDVGAVKDGSIDLVVCSPPYANATDYHLYHRFRLFWLGFDPHEMARARSALTCVISARKRASSCTKRRCAECWCGSRQRCELDAMQRWLSVILYSRARRSAQPMFCLKQPQHAASRRWAHVGRFTRPNAHSSSRVVELESEDIVLLRKPPKRLKVFLGAPKYRLWPYEERLRRMEASTLLKTKLPDTIELQSEVDCYEVNRVRRLTFTRDVHLDGECARPTWQAALESSDPASNRKDPKYLTHGNSSLQRKVLPTARQVLAEHLRRGAGRNRFRSLLWQRYRAP